MVSSEATNPKLTEQGLTHVFRMVRRDDAQGQIAGDLLAERWSNQPIAILHDGSAYGKGLAEETKKRFNQRGVAEAIFEAIEPGRVDYWDIVQKMRAMGVKVYYYGGYRHEAGLIIRHAREHGYELRLVAGDGISNEDFGLIAGPASDGTLMTLYPSPSGPGAAEFAARFPEDIHPPFPVYAAIQVWAQAVEKAGTFETEAAAAALRTHAVRYRPRSHRLRRQGRCHRLRDLRLVRLEGRQVRASGPGQAHRVTPASSGRWNHEVLYVEATRPFLHHAGDRRAGPRRGADRPRSAVDRTHGLGRDQAGRGAEVAVADLNARDGVLGEQLERVTADDYCDGEQAVAAANKLVAAGIVQKTRRRKMERRHLLS